MIYNLRNFNGTFKGRIGECMAKLTHESMILTQHTSPARFIEWYKHCLTTAQLAFLRKHWYTIDAISYNSFDQTFTTYEIKTRNFYASQQRAYALPPKATKHAHTIYTTAQDIGFIVELIIVYLHENWEFTVNYEPYHLSNIWLDEPKKYDKKEDNLPN